MHQSLLRFIRYATLRYAKCPIYSTIYYYHPSEKRRAAVVYCAVVVILVPRYVLYKYSFLINNKCLQKFELPQHMRTNVDTY